MRIGKVAAQANVNIQTVRLYERMGLLERPRRLASGYRDYAADTVWLIRFIKRSQKLGFTLSEIKTFIQLRGQADYCASDIYAIAQAKMAELDEKIRHLQEMRNAIEYNLNACTCHNPYPLCMLVEQRESDVVVTE
ncbi:MAG: heavy metal-responsive transcriptional regulator [Acidobacteria bacterium]|nr:heavy metal-responsive transcriptional regulator [Acidobacteriota bacterium]